jgi:hypothetical protein
MQEVAGEGIEELCSGFVGKWFAQGDWCVSVGGGFGCCWKGPGLGMWTG